MCYGSQELRKTYISLIYEFLSEKFSVTFISSLRLLLWQLPRVKDRGKALQTWQVQERVKEFLIFLGLFCSKFDENSACNTV